MEPNPCDTSDAESADGWAVIQKMSSFENTADNDSQKVETSDDESFIILDENEVSENETRVWRLDTVIPNGEMKCAINDGHESDTISLSTDYDSEDLEIITEHGEKRYFHRPNDHVNSVLNMLLVLTLAGVAGLGIGHFLGSQEDRIVTSKTENPLDKKCTRGKLADNLGGCIQDFKFYEEYNSNDICLAYPWMKEIFQPKCPLSLVENLKINTTGMYSTMVKDSQILWSMFNNRWKLAGNDISQPNNSNQSVTQVSSELYFQAEQDILLLGNSNKHPSPDYSVNEVNPKHTIPLKEDKSRILDELRAALSSGLRLTSELSKNLKRLALALNKLSAYSNIDEEVVKLLPEISTLLKSLKINVTNLHEKGQLLKHESPESLEDNFHFMKSIFQSKVTKRNPHINISKISGDMCNVNVSNNCKVCSYFPYNICSYWPYGKYSKVSQPNNNNNNNIHKIKKPTINNVQHRTKSDNFLMKNKTFIVPDKIESKLHRKSIVKIGNSLQGSRKQLCKLLCENTNQNGKNVIKKGDCKCNVFKNKTSVKNVGMHYKNKVKVPNKNKFGDWKEKKSYHKKYTENWKNIVENNNHENMEHKKEYSKSKYIQGSWMFERAASSDSKTKNSERSGWYFDRMKSKDHSSNSTNKKYSEDWKNYVVRNNSQENMTQKKEYSENKYIQGNWIFERAAARDSKRKNSERSGWYFDRMKSRDSCRNSTNKKCKSYSLSEKHAKHFLAKHFNNGRDHSVFKDWKFRKVRKFISKTFINAAKFLNM